MSNLAKFKEITEKKAPLLYSYLNEHLPHEQLIEELLLNTFARFYRTYAFMPKTLNSDQWIVLIVNKYLIDFCNWRITEGADFYLPVTTYQASLIKDDREALFKEWVAALSEAEREIVDKYIVSDLEVKVSNNPVADLVEKKIAEWGDKYGQPKK